MKTSCINSGLGYKLESYKITSHRILKEKYRPTLHWQ